MRGGFFNDIKLYLVLMVSLSVGFCFASLEHTRASDGASWLNGVPILTDEIDYRKQAYFYEHSKECKLDYVNVAGAALPQHKCIMNGPNIGVDSMLEYIRIGFDQQYYKVHGMRSAGRERIYLPSTNKMITRSGFALLIDHGTLSIESGIPGSLTPVYYTPGVREYQYTPNFDFTFSDSNGTISIGRGVGFSNNGRWLAVEVINVGLVRIDLENDYKAELFSTLSPRYGVGLNRQ